MNCSFPPFFSSSLLHPRGVVWWLLWERCFLGRRTCVWWSWPINSNSQEQTSHENVSSGKLFFCFSLCVFDVLRQHTRRKNRISQKKKKNFIIADKMVRSTWILLDWADERAKKEPAEARPFEWIERLHDNWIEENSSFFDSLSYLKVGKFYFVKLDLKYLARVGDERVGKYIFARVEMFTFLFPIFIEQLKYVAMAALTMEMVLGMLGKKIQTLFSLILQHTQNFIRSSSLFHFFHNSKFIWCKYHTHRKTEENGN